MLLTTQHKIGRFFNEERFLDDNITGDRYYSDYVHMNKWDCPIALLIYGSVTEISTMETGPHSNYCG